MRYSRYSSSQSCMLRRRWGTWMRWRDCIGAEGAGSLLSVFFVYGCVHYYHCFLLLTVKNIMFQLIYRVVYCPPIAFYSYSYSYHHSVIISILAATYFLLLLLLDCFIPPNITYFIHLSRHGAAIDAKMDDGLTPLMLACGKVAKQSCYLQAENANLQFSFLRMVMRDCCVGRV